MACARTECKFQCNKIEVGEVYVVRHRRIMLWLVKLDGQALEILSVAVFE